MPSFITKLIPFIIFGIILALLMAGLILLSYFLVIGALIGLVLFIITWIRERFFSHKKNASSMANILKKTNTIKKKHGHTIDHHDI